MFPIDVTVIALPQTILESIATHITLNKVRYMAAAKNVKVPIIT